MRQRKRIDHLQSHEIVRLEQAFDDISSVFAEPFDFEFWASVHQVCPHHSALFLPWHRAYVFAFEEAVRREIGDETFALPYWDWVAQPTLPPIVTNPDSPLFRPDRYDPGNDPHRPKGVNLPSRSDVNRVLALPDFKTFGGGACSGSLKHGGELEVLHDWVHLWVSPEMSRRRTAAIDPVFWFHHGNVDRIWAAWQQDHAGGPGCTATDLVGILGCWTVRDVERIDGPRLGYEYVNDVVAVDRNVIVTTAAFAGVTLTLRFPATRVHLLLEDITVDSDELKPVAIELFRPGDEVPIVRRALFGVHGPAHPADQHHASPDSALHHDGQHRPEGHGPTNFRIDLTPHVSLDPSQGVNLRMRATPARADSAPTGLRIGRVMLVATD